MYRLSKRSLNNLVGVHPDLAAVVKRAIEITPVDFTVIEGRRTVERQRQLLASGASRTIHSRHITGHAVDLMAYVPGDEWNWKHYPRIAAAMKQAADELGTPIVWGGDWASFKDGPHFELASNVYP